MLLKRSHCLLLVFATCLLQAGQISVPNYSFENDAPGFGNPDGWTLFSSTTSPTFTDNVRTVANDGSVYPVMAGIDGSQFAAVNLDHNYLTGSYTSPVVPPEGSLDGLESGDLGFFAAGTSYVLTADIGLSQALDSLDIGLALGSGAPTLADVYPTPGSASFASILINGSQLSDNQMVSETLILDTALFPSLVGQPIDVSLIFHSSYPYGRQGFFDDVTFTDASDVPEPSSAVLCLIGVLLASGLHKGRRSASSAPSISPSELVPFFKLNLKIVANFNKYLDVS